MTGTALVGRPAVQKSENRDTQTGAKTRADGEMIKIGTRLTVEQHRRMKVVAAQQDMTIEDAYREAVDRYLQGH